MKKTAEKRNRRSGVVICGAYGMGNAGDEAILEAIVSEMRAIDPAMPVTVLTRNPEETAAKLGVRTLHTFDVFSFLRAARGASLYVNGGGSLIQDVTSRRSLWYYLFTLGAAKKRGCRVMMYGCGIGPVFHKDDVRLARRVLNRYVDVITLREPDSVAELAKFGVTNPEIILSSDPALTLPAAPPEKADAVLAENGAAGGKYICFALRRWPGFNEKAACFAEAAKYAYKKYGLMPVFLSINHNNDGDAAARVTAALGKNPYCCLPGPMSSDMTIGVMARMEIVVSMRLHGLIFASGQGVPLIGVSYDPKVTAFLRCVEGACVELQDVTAENLCSLIDGAAALRDNKTKLTENVQRLRALEGRNALAARALLGKEKGTTHD